MAASPGERARIRAGTLPRDPRFRQWLARANGGDPVDEDDAAQYIREACCDGNSRSMIATTPEYRAAFERLEDRYMVETGLRMEVR